VGHRDRSVAEVDPSQHVRRVPVDEDRGPAPLGQVSPLGGAQQPGDRAAMAGEGVARDAPAALALAVQRGAGRDVEQQQVQRAATAPGLAGEPAAHPGLRTAVVHDESAALAQGAAQAGVVREADEGAVDRVRQQPGHPAVPAVAGVLRGVAPGYTGGYLITDQTNLKGAWLTAREFAAHLKEKERPGRVINISSMLAHGGVAHLLPYSATKAALNLMTRNIAHTVRHNGVRVHAINLGWTVTPAEHITQTQVHGFPEDWAEKEGAKQPFGRLVLPEDAAGLCAFLASTDATMMTGNIIDLEQWVSGVLG